MENPIKDTPTPAQNRNQESSLIFLCPSTPTFCQSLIPLNFISLNSLKSVPSRPLLSTLPYARFLHYLSLGFLQQSTGLQPSLSPSANHLPHSSQSCKPDHITPQINAITYLKDKSYLNRTKLSHSPVLHSPPYFNPSTCLKLHVQTLLFHASTFLPALLLLSGIPTPS